MCQKGTSRRGDGQPPCRGRPPWGRPRSPQLGRGSCNHRSRRPGSAHSPCHDHRVSLGSGWPRQKAPFPAPWWLPEAAGAAALASPLCKATGLWCPPPATWPWWPWLSETRIGGHGGVSERGRHQCTDYTAVATPCVHPAYRASPHPSSQGQTTL